MKIGIYILLAVVVLAGGVGLRYVVELPQTAPPPIVDELKGSDVAMEEIKQPSNQQDTVSAPPSAPTQSPPPAAPVVTNCGSVTVTEDSYDVFNTCFRSNLQECKPASLIIDGILDPANSNQFDILGYKGSLCEIKHTVVHNVFVPEEIGTAAVCEVDNKAEYSSDFEFLFSVGGDACTDVQ